MFVFPIARDSKHCSSFYCCEFYSKCRMSSQMKRFKTVMLCQSNGLIGCLRNTAIKWSMNIKQWWKFRDYSTDWLAFMGKWFFNITMGFYTNFIIIFSSKIWKLNWIPKIKLTKMEYKIPRLFHREECNGNDNEKKCMQTLLEFGILKIEMLNARNRHMRFSQSQSQSAIS